MIIMVVTKIIPCIKIIKECNMSAMEMYIDYGTKVRIIDEKGTIIIGTILFLELSQYEEQDDILFLLLDNGKQFNTGTSYIVEIEEL